MNIITEGRFDAAVLSHLLREVGVSDVKVMSGTGPSGAVSLARSVLATRKEPVTLVLDADTSDPAAARDKQLIYTDLLRSVAGEVPVRVFLFLPELEAIFFTNRSWFEKALGEAVKDEYWYGAHLRPRHYFSQLISLRAARGTEFSFLDRLHHDEWRELAGTKWAKQLLAGLRPDAKVTSASAIVAPLNAT